MTGVLVTVRPGPTLHLWQGGREVARVPLGAHAALELAAALLRKARAALARDWGAQEPRQALAYVTHPRRHRGRHGPAGGLCGASGHRGGCPNVQAEPRRDRRRALIFRIHNLGHPMGSAGHLRPGGMLNVRGN
jgi:hypothetical protein